MECEKCKCTVSMFISFLSFGCAVVGSGWESLLWVVPEEIPTLFRASLHLHSMDLTHRDVSC